MPCDEEGVVLRPDVVSVNEVECGLPILQAGEKGDSAFTDGHREDRPEELAHIVIAEFGAVLTEPFPELVARERASMLSCDTFDEFPSILSSREVFPWDSRHASPPWACPARAWQAHSFHWYN